MVVLLAGGRGFTRREGLRRVKERLENVPGASRVRYEPSAIRPRSVIADIDIEMFLGQAFPRSEGRIEVSWWPREEMDVQRVQWSDDAVSLGWHKDDDHPSLSTTHFQRRRPSGLRIMSRPTGDDEATQLPSESSFRTIVA